MAVASFSHSFYFYNYTKFQKTSKDISRFVCIFEGKIKKGESSPPVFHSSSISFRMYSKVTGVTRQSCNFFKSFSAADRSSANHPIAARSIRALSSAWVKQISTTKRSRFLQQEILQPLFHHPVFLFRIAQRTLPK